MKRNQKFILLGTLLVFTLVIGMSYAIWQVTLKQESTNVITTGCFKIELKDKNEISLQSAYPITNEEGVSLIPYEFTITNTCKSYASFQINLEVLENTTLTNQEYINVMFENKIESLTKKKKQPRLLQMQVPLINYKQDI